MLQKFGVRLGGALAISAIVLSALAAPVSAASRTRWVDDDHKNGDGPAACNTAKFHSIQSAIDASSPGDRVYVCPGTYDEQVIVTTPNVLIQAKPTRAATIVPPEASELEEVDNGYDVVDILANKVSFVGFKINIPAGEATAGLLPQTCMELDSGIYATGSGLNIKANAIKAVGNDSLSGECGYLVGIGLRNPDALPAAKIPSLPAKIDVSRNRIVDFKFVGVYAIGTNSRVYSNAIRYVHANDPATCVITPVLGVNPSLGFPCDFEGAAPHAQDLPFEESGGIIAEGGKADVRNNTIYSTFDLDLCEFECTQFLGVGVGMFETAPGSKIRNNRIENVGFGVAMGEVFLPVGAQSSSNASAAKANLPPAPGGTQVTGNRVNSSFFGMFVSSSSNVFYGNRAHMNFAGMLVVDGADNVFDSNDFRYNLDGDCMDETSGSGTLDTANNWDAPNLGNYNTPDGLCFATFSPI
jgi:parallel beta-helix repeat protein